jgi:predicted nucleic acid-binding protein
MNIVDFSGWLAYFADEPNARHFLIPLKNSSTLIVPSITIHEVFKVVLRESSENEALQAVAAMRKGTVVDLTAARAMAASKLSLELASHDRQLILAAAEEFAATLWTQDADFKKIEGVKYFPKR